MFHIDALTDQVDKRLRFEPYLSWFFSNAVPRGGVGGEIDTMEMLGFYNQNGCLSGQIYDVQKSMGIFSLKIKSTPREG